jgi:hypothetical protein
MPASRLHGPWYTPEVIPTTVHRFEFSSEIMEVKVCELITLGFLEP